MVAASYVQSSFLGGEVSKAAQGRLDHPGYRTWMNVCLNSMPMEQGAWTRRPGTMHLGFTRGGLPGRVIGFDFKQSSPYTMEFTSGFLRFRAGPNLVMTNDQQTVSAISAANPAKVTTGTHGWATGNQVAFNSLGVNNPLLQSRIFEITVTSGTEFTITDAITGANIDGSTLGAFVSGNVTRVLEFGTPYINLAPLRAIQTDIPLSTGTTPGAVLLKSNMKPYVLQVLTPPSSTAFATFSFLPAVFSDGPYFDPFTNGAEVTPSAKSGIVSLNISFPAYSATQAYAKGSFVSFTSINYESLVDQNVNHQPDVSPSQWVAVSASAAINDGRGFLGTDIGRMVRLFSEPDFWNAGATYAVGAVVAYNPANIPGETTYWTSLIGSNIGKIPGNDTVSWTLTPANAALWSWGVITSLSTQISGSLAGSVNIGDMTNGGGLAAAFDGVLNKIGTASAEKIQNAATITSYVGKNYTGAAAQKIATATIYPSTDHGYSDNTDATGPAATITINLRAKASAPASSSDGTLLGTAGPFTNSTAAVSITSNDAVTAWNYVWFEIIGALGLGGAANTNFCAQALFFNPPGTGTSTGVNVEILGPPLLYTTPIRTWRLGLYSDTTGWPSCGTYHEGRLWLSGSVANRIDGSESNQPFNFSPTNQDGTVAGNNAIAYVFNAPDVNPIFWMAPDHLGIICGTQAGEWLVQATSQNLPLTPTTIQAHRYTKYNCANILPARTNLTLAVVQTFKRELLEYFGDVYSGRFSAHDLALYAKHLVASGIEEVGYQQELIPIVWSRCGDGSLVGVTYGRQSLVSSQPPDASGWHRHTLGSGRVVESITIGGNEDGTLDALVMVTNDTGTGLRHVEMLTTVFMETDSPADAWFLDDAVRPSSTSSGAGLTVNGLWHLNGKTVQVFAAGLDCGDVVVTNGTALVPYTAIFTAGFATAAVAAGQVVIGFTYISDGQIVRPNAPAESGARNGPAFGKLRRNQQYALQTIQSSGLSIGTTFTKLDPVLFNAEDAPAQAAGSFFTGVYRSPLYDNDSFDGMICWRVTRPLPATITVVGGFVHTKDI